MVELVVVTLLTVTATSYRSVPSQTDATPFITSIGHRTHPYGVAVSRDLLVSGQVCYGDVLEVPGYGLRVVNDTMNARHKRHIDIFVDTRAQERAFGVRSLTVRVIWSPQRACSREKAEKQWR